MEEHNFNQNFLALIVLTVLSVAVFVVSSEVAYKLERQRRFDFANPLYVFMVLAAIGSAATGGFSLIALTKMANAELSKNV